jgi:hypothetical protein
MIRAGQCAEMMEQDAEASAPSTYRGVAGSVPPGVLLSGRCLSGSLQRCADAVCLVRTWRDPRYRNSLSISSTPVLFFDLSFPFCIIIAYFPSSFSLFISLFPSILFIIRILFHHLIIRNLLNDPTPIRKLT